MTSLIEHRQQIAEICGRHQVNKLELFGSAARGDFDAQTSDLDLLVEFRSYDGPSIADQWFGLQEDIGLRIIDQTRRVHRGTLAPSVIGPPKSSLIALDSRPRR